MVEFGLVEAFAYTGAPTFLSVDYPDRIMTFLHSSAFLQIIYISYDISADRAVKLLLAVRSSVFVFVNEFLCPPLQ